MAILQVYLPRRMDGNKVLNSLTGNAEFYIVGTSVNVAKSLLYKGSLLRPEMPLTNDEKLLTFPYKSGKFNLPVRNNIIFKSKEGIIINLSDVSIDVSLTNTIVKTPMTGLRGTVKEYVCAEDYRVTVTGSLISEKPDAFPIEDLQQFIKLLQDEGQIKVTSVYLDAFGIDKVVLDNYRIPQNDSKFVNQQKFTLVFYSDIDVELEFNDLLC